MESLRYLLFQLPRHPEQCPAVPRTMDSERIWVHPRFLSTILDVEPHVRNWFRKYLQPGGVVFDVGAYVGWHSIYAAKIVGATGKVVAFEPSPANAFCIGYHLKKNRLPWIQVLQVAVSESAGGEATFHLLNDGDSTSNSLNFSDNFVAAQANQAMREIKVPVITLDSFSAESGLVPDLVKIDIEGAELLALRGSRKLLEGRRPPLILAVHPAWLPDNQSTADIFSFLESVGYEIFGEDGARPATLELADYLCLPKGATP